MKAEIRTNGTHVSSVVIEGVEFAEDLKEGFSLRYVNGDMTCAELTMTVYVTDLAMGPGEPEPLPTSQPLSPGRTVHVFPESEGGHIGLGGLQAFITSLPSVHRFIDSLPPVERED